MDLRELVNDPNNKVVDVRETYEFRKNHAEGAINIPLSELTNRVEELRKMGGKILLCCASGNRSGNAEAYLKDQGIDNVINVGGWKDVQNLQSEINS